MCPIIPDLASWATDKTAIVRPKKVTSLENVPKSPNSDAISLLLFIQFLILHLEDKANDDCHNGTSTASTSQHNTGHDILRSLRVWIQVTSIDTRCISEHTTNGHDNRSFSQWTSKSRCDPGEDELEWRQDADRQEVHGEHACAQVVGCDHDDVSDGADEHAACDVYATFFGARGVVGYKEDDDEGGEPDGNGEKKGGGVVVAEGFDN